jgi:alpha-beta hydrolase superfamily lysophospholipase
VSPDGADHFPVVHAKTLHMILTEPEIDLATLREVAMPTLVLQGDRDEVTLEHSQAVAATLRTPGWPSCPGRTSCRSSRPRW